jgi:hypothetical protein
VIDELTEERVTGRDVGIVRSGAGRFTHLRGQVAQQLIRWAEALELLEHHAEPGFPVPARRQHDVAAAWIPDRVSPGPVDGAGDDLCGPCFARFRATRVEERAATHRRGRGTDTADHPSASQSSSHICAVVRTFMGAVMRHLRLLG